MDETEIEEWIQAIQSAALRVHELGGTIIRVEYGPDRSEGIVLWAHTPRRGYSQEWITHRFGPDGLLVGGSYRLDISKAIQDYEERRWRTKPVPV